MRCVLRVVERSLFARLFLRRRGYILASQSGMTLTSTIIAIGLSVLVGLAFVSVMSNLFSASIKVFNMVSAYDSVYLVAAVLNNAATCDGALQDAGGDLLIAGAGPLTVNITNVVIDNPNDAAGVVVLVGPGSPINQLMSINTLQFRETAQSVAARRSITVGPTTYNFFTGEVVFRFTKTGTASQEGMADRTIPVCLATNAATNRVAFCCNNQSPQRLCASIGGTVDARGNCSTAMNLNNAGFVCTAANINVGADCPGIDLARCTKNYMIDGFSAADLRPRCMCVPTCFRGDSF